MSERQIQTHHFHSDDPDEVSDFIRRIYADNQFSAQHALRRDVNMSGQEWNGIGIYDVDYQMPFDFHSEEMRPNYLFLSCNRGGSTYSSGKAETACIPGDVLPISSTGNSRCTTGADGFGHLSVIIDAEKVNGFLAQWIGQPLAEPVRFNLELVSQDISAQWNMGAKCLHQMMHMAPIPDASADSLLEHMLKMLVTGHPNNYSTLLDKNHYAQEHQARIAMGMIAADPMRWKTLGAIAHALGCATNALEKGIRRLAGKSSADIFYEARLNCVNRALARGDGHSFVGTLRTYGCSISGRFVRDYSRRFGEPPSATYRKNPNAAEAASLERKDYDALCERTINQFIDASLGRSIGLVDIARLVGMSEHATIVAFKEQFSRTPIQYVIERRLERARWLLRHTSSSILLIAIECGFGTQSYLTTAMKKHFGVTPRQLRLSPCPDMGGKSS